MGMPKEEAYQGDDTAVLFTAILAGGFEANPCLYQDGHLRTETPCGTKWGHSFSNGEKISCRVIISNAGS